MGLGLGLGLGLGRGRACVRHSVVVILRPSAQHARLACFDHEPSLHSALALSCDRPRRIAVEAALGTST